MLLDLWAWRLNSTTPPAGGRGGGGGSLKRASEVRGVTDPSLREAMLRSRIRQEDEELMVLVATFVRAIQ